VPSKTMLVGCAPDRAKKAHNCQANARHRINAGDLRLAVPKGRGKEYYCRECAVKILRRDQVKLEGLIASMEVI
jgi:hypothetical protein